MPLSDFMSLSVDGFVTIQLEDYGFKTEPIINPYFGRTGSKYTVEGEGYVDAADSPTFVAAAGAASTVLNRSGSRIVITGLNGVTELSLDARNFINGGPHMSIQMMGKPDSPLRRQIKFKVTGETSPSGSGNGQPVEVGYKVDIATRPDGLRTATRTGEIHGAGSAQSFLSTIRPAILQGYPATQWVASFKYDQNSVGDKVTYSYQFTELRIPLPTSGGATVVDGEVTVRTDRDEQMRKVVTRSFDLLIQGDVDALVTTLRPVPPAIVLKESLDYSAFKERRVRYSFTQLFGANGSDLLNWQQTFEEVQDTSPLEIETYPGSFPDFYYKPKSGNIYNQSGSAIAVGKYPQAPDPALPNSLEKPHVTYKKINEAEYQTTWTYVLFSPNVIEVTAAYLVKFERPANPVFIK